MTVTVRDENDLIHSIPYQVGFAPVDSLVVIALRGTAVQFTVRADLPLPDQERRTASDVVNQTVRHRPDAVTLVAYRARNDSSGLLRAVRALFEQSGVDVTHVLVVTPRGWRHVDCVPACCGDGFHPLTRPESSRVAAEFVALGVAPFADRETIRAQLQPDPIPLDETDLAQTATPVNSQRAWKRFTSPHRDDHAVSDEEVVALARSLIDRDWRDAVIAVLAPGVLPYSALDADVVARAFAAIDNRRWAADPPPDASVRELEELTREAAFAARSGLVHRLIALARRSPTHLSAGTYTVLAMVAGWAGEGAIANLSVDQALAADPSYRLAQLLRKALANGIVPGRPPWPPGEGETVR